jgi:RimJ/RimL family protein N-acetyltransferase
MDFRVPVALSTNRLVLRMFTERDWEPLAEMFADEECVKYTVGSVQPKYWVWRQICAYLGHWQIRGYGPYAVVEKTSGELLGPVGLWCPGDWPEPEIKYSIRRKFWGNGYVSEAAFAVQQMAAKELKWTRLISLINPANERSKAVARRIGGELEKTIPFRDGQAEVFAYKLTPG